MSSTTTSSSSTSDSSSEDDGGQQKFEIKITQQAQDEEDLTTPRKGHLLKRKRKSDKFFEGKSEDDETKEPEPKRRKLRKLEVPQLTGHVLYFEDIGLDVIKGIIEELKDPLVTKLYPNVKAEIIDVKYLKRLPTAKQRQEWDAETKRLSREKRKAEGKYRKELTEEEKEQRRLKNLDPVNIEKKKIRNGIRKQVYDSNPENKAEYIRRCEAVLGKVVRQRKPRVKKDAPKKEEEKVEEEKEIEVE
jgi:hypothetical protein